MKKKIVWLVVSCLMVVSLVMASCAAPAVTNGEGLEAEIAALEAELAEAEAELAETEAELAAALAGEEEEVFEWRMQSHLTLTSLEDWGYIDMCDRVEEASGGRLKITMYPIGALCPAADILLSCAGGMIELGWTDCAYHGGFMPEAQITQLPFSYRTLSDIVQTWYHYGLKDYMEESYALHGVRLITHTFSYTGVMLISSVPIERVSDFADKGIKLRTVGTKQLFFDELGAATTYIPGDETYTAIALGTIHAATWGAEATFIDWKWYEVAKYLIYPAVGGGANDMHVNPDAWASLPADLKLILTEIPTMFAQQWTGENLNYLNTLAKIELIEKYGCTPCYIPQEDYPLLTAAASKVWDDVAGKSDRAYQAVKMLTDYLRDIQGYTDFKLD